MSEALTTKPVISGPDWALSQIPSVKTPFQRFTLLALSMHFPPDYQRGETLSLTDLALAMAEPPISVWNAVNDLVDQGFLIWTANARIADPRLMAGIKPAPTIRPRPDVPPPSVWPVAGESQS